MDITNGIIRTLDSNPLATVDQLITVVVIIGAASLGLIQFIKEIPACKKWSKRFLTILILLGVTFLRTYFVDKWVADLFTVFLLAMSFSKIGYDAFVEGIPNLIRGRLAALGGSQPQINSKEKEK